MRNLPEAAGFCLKSELSGMAVFGTTARTTNAGPAAAAWGATANSFPEAIGATWVGAAPEEVTSALTPATGAGEPALFPVVTALPACEPFGPAAAATALPLPEL